MQKVLISVFILINVLILSFSCNPTKDVFKKTPVLLPGFVLLPGPNSLDKPGTIFGVDQNGVKQPLGIIHIEPLSGPVEVGSSSGKRDSKVGTLLKFLGNASIPVTADANVNANQLITYSIELDGATQERLQLLQISQELEKTKNLIRDFSANNDLQKYKFYLISESVKANSLSYTFDKDKAGQVGLKAKVNQVAEINPSVKWDNTSDFKLEYDLPGPLYVYAKFFRLSIETQVTGGSKFRLGNEVKEGEQIYEK